MTSTRFGDCSFDPAAHVLTRAGREVPLSRRAFVLLGILVERRPAVLTHAELRDRLWPDTFVGYAGLPALVSEIRKALGHDEHGPRFLRTVHGVGSAFIGETQPRSGGGPRLSPFVLRWRGREFPRFRERTSLAALLDGRSRYLRAGCPGITPGWWWRATTPPSRTSEARTAPWSKAGGPRLRPVPCHWWTGWRSAWGRRCSVSPR